MNRDRLKRILDEQGFDPSAYSLFGGHPSEGLGIAGQMREALDRVIIGQGLLVTAQNLRPREEVSPQGHGILPDALPAGEELS
ncbi:MAG: hypothetical protein JWP76_6117 [Dactylosporangium sp.]|jgi:hypothetical protein|nr:hypothetical protein [Dactylosporangium sp.]